MLSGGTIVILAFLVLSVTGTSSAQELQLSISDEDAQAQYSVLESTANAICAVQDLGSGFGVIICSHPSKNSSSTNNNPVVPPGSEFIQLAVAGYGCAAIRVLNLGYRPRVCGLTRFGDIRCSLGVTGKQIVAFDPVPEHSGLRFAQVVTGFRCVCGIDLETRYSVVHSLNSITLCCRKAVCFGISSIPTADAPVSISGTDDAVLLAAAGNSADSAADGTFCALIRCW